MKLCKQEKMFPINCW